MTVSKTDPRWLKLIDGSIAYQFKAISASMLFGRLHREYKNSPQSASALVDEAYAFFSKYEAVFAEDLKKIFA